QVTHTYTHVYTHLNPLIDNQRECDKYCRTHDGPLLKTNTHMPLYNCAHTHRQTSILTTLHHTPMHLYNRAHTHTHTDFYNCAQTHISRLSFTHIHLSQNSFSTVSSHALLTHA